MNEHLICDLDALHALYGEVNDVSRLKEIDYLHPHYAALIAASPSGHALGSRSAPGAGR